MADGFAYFTSDDAGAPVLNGAAGRMIALLDWALVGKGGWTKAFTGTNLAAYRSDSGNRFFLRVDDTQTTYARMKGYRVMTTVSAGTLPFPTTAQGPTNTHGARKAFVAGTTPRQYWGIRTNKFILVVQNVSDRVADAGTQSVDYRQVWAFGDVPSLCEADAFATVFLPGYYDNVSIAQTPSTPTGNFVDIGVNPGAPGVGNLQGMLGIAATPDGGIASPVAAVVWPQSFNNTVPGPSEYAKPNRMHFSDIIAISANVTGTGSGLYGHWRLKIPNLKALAYPISFSSSGGNDPNNIVNDLEDTTIGARGFKAFAGQAGVPNTPYAGFLLEKTDTDGAL